MSVAMLAAVTAQGYAQEAVTHADARRVAAAARGRALSKDEAQRIASDLVSKSTTPVAFGAAVDPAALAQTLADAHMEWQQGRLQSIHEEKLAQALNAQLKLNSLPGYERIRVPDIRRVRLLIWTKVPELSTGVDRHNKGRGNRPTAAFGPFMSPFEAFLVADWVIYSKAENDEYVLTDAEQKARINTPRAEQEPLHAQPVNPRRQEFAAHVATVAMKQYGSAQDLSAALNDLLGRHK